MAKNLRLFETTDEYTSAQSEFEFPTVSYVEETSEVHYMEDTANGHEYVDLGLPSGLKWATCNVGATKPEEYGLYFAWGETEGYSNATSGKEFSWYDYKYGDGSTFEKYTGADDKLVLDLTDDAAHVNMGGNWRMPTEAECKELRANTTYAWTTVNGVYGMNFTSKSDKSKSIFVPAAGRCKDGSVNLTGSYGCLRSSSLNSSDVANAFGLFCESSGAHTNFSYRYFGDSVRGVLA